MLVLTSLLAVSAAINVIDMVSDEWETFKVNKQNKRNIL
jgi:hypothetical protein